MAGRLWKVVGERSRRGNVALGGVPGASVPGGQSRSNANLPARPAAQGGLLSTWLHSFGPRFREAKPRSLGMGLMALFALVLIAVVAAIILGGQRRPPEFTGVFDAQPLHDTTVDRQHEGTKPEPRDRGTVGLAETPPVLQSVPLAPAIASANDANRSILGLLPSMPSGGGSEANAKSVRDLQEAIQIQGHQLRIKPEAAQTTYSSGATYLVFLQALQSLLPPGTLSGSLAEALTVRGQPDGVGVWGRWNANGPGIACLFDELQLGRNFISFEDAQPGDFMKAFFVDAVGRREHSLSMIYLGREQQNGIELVRVWSSIKPFGYGEAVIPRSNIKFAIFSRLENPANIARVPRLAAKDRYLASLLTTDSSKEEAMAKSGVR